MANISSAYTGPAAPKGNNGVAPQHTNRMLLSAVSRGRVATPITVLLYGTEGIGKSSWASNAPKAIILDADGGTAHLDVIRFPKPDSWADALDAIRTLATEAHEYGTLVIDTLDALEPLCWAHICHRDGQKDIEDYGYGKGYVAALGEWRRLIVALEATRRRGMSVILIGHSLVRPFKNPAGPDYDRYTLKLHDKASGLLKEWCDAVLFATYEEYTVVKDGTTKGKAVATGNRIVHTQRRAAWDAKNRFDLPETLPLNWDDFAVAVAAHRPADPVKLFEEVTQLALALGDEDIAKWVAEAATKHAKDAAALAKIKDRLSAKLAEKA